MEQENRDQIQTQSRQESQSQQEPELQQKPKSKTKPLILDFGIHIGKQLSDPSIPDDYMGFLASDKEYYGKKNPFELTFRVPLKVYMAARQEMERRGYKRIGERWEKEDE